MESTLVIQLFSVTIGGLTSGSCRHSLEGLLSLSTVEKRV